ncbi:MAG TPA: hypothetical protein DDW52_16560 [Planctomycetaceae bacterium]|nr:hypothetical protein [Planctomycetaceae bacterium]
MQTIKTGVVIALLLAVCYGAFVALNAPDSDVPDELRDWAMEGELDELDIGEIEIPDEGQLTSTSGFDGFSSPPAIPGMDTGNEAVGSGLGSTDLGGELTLPPEIGNAAALNALPSVDLQNLAGPELLDPGQTLATNAPPATPDMGSGGLGVPPLGAIAQSDAQGTPQGSNPIADPNSLPQFPTDSFGASGSSTGTAATTISHSKGLPGSVGVGATSELGGTPLDANTGSLAPTIPNFSVARQEWLTKAQNGEYRAALENLSPYFASPELTYAEQTDLENILDPLCRRVIYSTDHLVLPGHMVARGESVNSIAEQYSITPALLAKINGLGSEQSVTPGTKLKVVQGPFSAQVSISRNELTVFLGKMYAGRFSVSFGKENYPKPGVFEVVDKRTDRTYYGAAQQVLSADDPRNPYGNHWISLGELSIHGSPEMASAELEEAGSISLAPLDAADVYDILSDSSPVKIVE